MNALLLDTELKERAPERPLSAIGPPPDRAAFMNACGVIVIVALGLTLVSAITLVALNTVPDGQKAAVVTAAFTVLGTTVGAYFGVKVGAEGKKRAEDARDAETVKVNELTARMDPESALHALDSAYRRIEQK